MIPNLFGQQFAPAVPIDLGSIEAAIVARLQSQINVVEIAAFRDNAREYRLTHRVGAILVRYTDSNYETARDAGLLTQDRDITFQADVIVRDLGWGMGGAGPTGIPNLADGYLILEAVRAALLGWRPPGAAKKIIFRADKAFGRDKEGGAWYYSLTFVVTTVAVEVPPVENYPLLLDAVIAMKLRGETIESILTSAAPAPADEVQNA